MERPDVADAREKIFLWGIEQDAFAPARGADGIGVAVGVVGGAGVEKSRNLWAVVARNPALVDELVGIDVGDFVVKRDQLHGGGRGGEEGAEGLSDGEPFALGVGDAVAPRAGDVARISEIFRCLEAVLLEPFVVENEAAVELVGDDPDGNFWTL